MNVSVEYANSVSNSTQVDLLFIDVMFYMMITLNVSKYTPITDIYLKIIKIIWLYHIESRSD